MPNDSAKSDNPKDMTQPINPKKRIIINLLFVVFCSGVLYFLLSAPEESTAFLPKDETHLEFHSIKSKKQAEKFCASCHADDKESPLPEGHPPKYRCLFCHKRK